MGFWKIKDNKQFGSDAINIQKGVVDSIKYETDKPGDNWQSPSKTLSRGSGDCEDKAILIMALINRDLVPMQCLVKKSRPSMVIGHNEETNGYHAMVLYLGMLYDSVSHWSHCYYRSLKMYSIYNNKYKIKYIIPMWQVPWICLYKKIELFVKKLLIRG